MCCEKEVFADVSKSGEGMSNSILRPREEMQCMH